MTRDSRHSPVRAETNEDLARALPSGAVTRSGNRPEPSWTLIALAWAVGLTIIYLTWSGSLI